MELFPLVLAQNGGLSQPLPPHERLIVAFLSGRSPRTLLAYGRDLDHFANWSNAPSRAEAARLLLSAAAGAANEAVLSYRSHLLACGLSPATVNRRLAALRSLVKLGEVLGLVNWHLQVPGIRSQ